MTERERLIELIEAGTRIAYDRSLEDVKRIVKENHHFNSATDRTVSVSEMVADFLLENGVIVPPVKVGEECIIRKIYPGNIATEKSEKAILTGIAYLTVNQNGTQIMSPENIFTVDETEKEREQK